MHRYTILGDTGNGPDHLLLEVYLDGTGDSLDLGTNLVGNTGLTLDEIEMWIDSSRNGLTDSAQRVNLVNDGSDADIPEDFIVNFPVNYDAIQGSLDRTRTFLRSVFLRGYNFRRVTFNDNLERDIRTMYRMKKNNPDTRVRQIRGVEYQAEAVNWHYNEEGHPESRWNGRGLTQNYMWEETADGYWSAQVPANDPTSQFSSISVPNEGAGATIEGFLQATEPAPWFKEA